MTAKLQNLKAQFRQRRAAVEAGHGEMRDWKWYDRMQEIMSDGTTETYTDFDGKSRGSNSRSPTPAGAQAQALNGKTPKLLTLKNFTAILMTQFDPGFKDHLTQVMEWLVTCPKLSNPFRLKFVTIQPLLPS